jgi:hypothetical protein
MASNDGGYRAQLWDVVLAAWRRLRRGRGSVVAAAGEPTASTLRVGARARFWAEFREGQREADARATNGRSGA